MTSLKRATEVRLTVLKVTRWPRSVYPWKESAPSWETTAYVGPFAPRSREAKSPWARGTVLMTSPPSPRGLKSSP